jgi:hypothetical protein
LLVFFDPRLGVVDFFVTGEAALNGRPQWVAERQLRVLPPARTDQMLINEASELQPFVQLAHPDQASVGSDPRSLKIDLEESMEGELKGLVLFLTR